MKGVRADNQEALGAGIIGAWKWWLAFRIPPTVVGVMVMAVVVVVVIGTH